MRQTNVRGTLSLRGFRKLRTGAIVATGVILLGLGFLAPTVSANEQDGVWVARTVTEVKADIQNIDNLSHYTIKWGDTLSAISGATGLSVDSLVEINRIANRDLIFANNKLYFSEEAFLKDGNTEVKRQRVSIDNSGSCQSYEVETKTDTVTGEQTTTVKQTTPVVVETPAATEPKADEPVVTTPKADEPVVTTPKADEPVATTPKADEPATPAPKAEEPATPAPKADEPTAGTAPKVEAPAATDPKSDEPVATDPKAEEPATPAPKADEPVVTTPQADEPAATTPKAEEPAATTPKADEPAATEPKSDEPSATTPKAEEPATPAPKAEEPAVGTTPKAEEPAAGTTPKSEESTAPAPKAEEAATTPAPKVEEPATPAPKSDEPAASEPKVEEPATPAPKSDEPAVPAPKVEEPSAGTTPKSDEPSAGTTPKSDEPSAGTTPKADEPSAGTTPKAEEPSAGTTPKADEPSAGTTPKSDEPATGATPKAEEPAAGTTPKAEEPATGTTPKAEEPSAGTTPKADEPSAGTTPKSEEPSAGTTPKAEEPSAGTTPKAEEPSAGTKEDAPSEEVAPKDEKLEEAKKDGKDAIEKIAASKLSEIEKVKDEAEKAKLEAKLKELKEAGLEAINNAKDHDAAVDATDEYQTKIDEINVPGEELPAPNYNKDNLTNGRNEGTTIDNGSTVIGHGSGEATATTPTQPTTERSTTTTATAQPSSTSEGTSSFRNAPSVQARARRVVRSTSEPDGTVNISYNFAGMPDIHGFLSDPGENNTVTIPAGTSEAQAKELVKEKIQAKIKDLATRGYHVKNDIIFEQDTTVKNYNYVVTFTKEATGTSGFRMAPAVQPRASRNRRSLEQPASQKVKVNVFYNFDQMKDIAGFLGDINGTPLEVAEGSTNEQVKAAVKNQVDAKKEELRKRGYTFKEDYVYQANGKDYNYVVTFTKEATGTSGFRMAPAVQPRASRNRRSLEQPAPQKVKVNVFYNFDQMKDIAGFLGDINGTSLEVAEGLSNEQVKAAVKSQVDAKKEELSKCGYTFKEDYVYQSNGKDYNYVVTFSKAAK